jgi:hypothetical protein
VLGGPDEIRQLVGKVIPVLIHQKKVAQGLVVYQRRQTLQQGAKLASVPPGHDYRDPVLGAEPASRFGRGIFTVNANTYTGRISHLSTATKGSVREQMGSQLSICP